MPGSFDVEFHSQQTREHQAWLDVVEELRAAGVGEINAGQEHESLHDAIVKWGEELAQLRFLDPDPEHMADALRERRGKYPGRYEKEYGAKT